MLTWSHLQLMVHSPEKSKRRRVAAPATSAEQPIVGDIIKAHTQFTRWAEAEPFQPRLCDNWHCWHRCLELQHIKDVLACSAAGPQSLAGSLLLVPGFGSPINPNKWVTLWRSYKYHATPAGASVASAQTDMTNGTLPCFTLSSFQTKRRKRIIRRKVKSRKKNF
jgi:hypothetical protein